MSKKYDHLHMTNEDLIKKLNSRTKINEKGCWLWTGATTATGYGLVQFNGKLEYVHRLSAYLHLKLDLNNKEQLALHKDDICNFRHCHNPSHLYVGNHYNNQRDRTLREPKRNFGPPITHCKKRNHEFTAENTGIQSGRRYCKKCVRIRLGREHE